MAPVSVHVVIASVPERRENLLALLEDITKQTYPIARVMCFLNGYASTIAVPDVSIDWSPVRRSAGYRWTYAERAEVADDDFMCVIDDDFRINPMYIESLMTGFTADTVGMVTWTGHPHLKKYYFLPSLRRTVSLIIGGTGLSAIRVRALRGITQHRFANELLGEGGDDELLVSILMRERGWSILRPAGTPPVNSIEHLQDAVTSSHYVHNARWEARRLELAKEYGWR